jgi:nucleoid DNA-binding protein
MTQGSTEKRKPCASPRNFSERKIAMAIAKKPAAKPAAKKPAAKPAAAKKPAAKPAAKAAAKPAAKKPAAKPAPAKKPAVAKKPAAAKPAAPKAAVKRSTSALAEAHNKTQLLAEIAELTELSKKQVTAVLEELGALIERHVKKNAVGHFTLPGLFKVQVIRKPATKARKGINPFTKEEVTFKAKPARNVIKVRPLKKLKDFAA